MNDLFEKQFIDSLKEMNTDQLLDYVHPYNLSYVIYSTISKGGCEHLITTNPHWVCCMTHENFHYEFSGTTPQGALRAAALYMYKNKIIRK